MDYRLAKGVDLHVIPTKQFKMTHILIDFATPQTTTNATARNLLANLLKQVLIFIRHKQRLHVRWQNYMEHLFHLVLVG